MTSLTRGTPCGALVLLLAINLQNPGPATRTQECARLILPMTRLGMRHSSWTLRPWADPAIGAAFSTTARDLARMGIMIQAGGRWGDQMIFEDDAFLEEMLSPSQALNPSYGYLWWLNGEGFSLAANARATRRDGPLVPAAPADLVAMLGARDRKLYIVPSLNLVVARLGDSGAADGEIFNDAFWEVLMRARR